MRWTLLIALLGLVACNKDAEVVDTETSTDDTSVDDTNTDDTQAETGSITVVVEFPTKPGVGPLIIGVATTATVFDSIVSSETYAAPTFPENQTQTLELDPGDYYIGAWIDEGSDNPGRPGETDPRGIALQSGPLLVTVAAGATETPPAIKLRRPSVDEE